MEIIFSFFGVFIFRSVYDVVFTKLSAYIVRECQTAEKKLHPSKTTLMILNHKSEEPLEIKIGEKQINVSFIHSFIHSSNYASTERDQKGPKGQKDAKRVRTPNNRSLL